jgi:hypothetical protein
MKCQSILTWGRFIIPGQYIASIDGRQFGSCTKHETRPFNFGRGAVLSFVLDFKKDRRITLGPLIFFH